MHITTIFRIAVQLSFAVAVDLGSSGAVDLGSSEEVDLASSEAVDLGSPEAVDLGSSEGRGSRAIGGNKPASAFFTNIEEVAYAVVEHIPFTGTIYSFKRAGFAYKARDWKRYWITVANLIESGIRDLIISTGTIEPTHAVILHDVAESFTDKVLDLFLQAKPQVNLTTVQRLRDTRGYALVTESRPGSRTRKVFGGAAKGVFHFLGAQFTGILTHPLYAPRGEKIHLAVPQGFITGGQATFAWKWTTNYEGSTNVPEATHGTLRIVPDEPKTRFGLSKRIGAKGWEGYDFWGDILTTKTLKVYSHIDGHEVSIDMTRVPDT